MKILWIAGWYPNQLEPFNGDFVQRHAKAVSLYHEVFVINISRDATGSVTDSLKVDEITEGQLTEKRVYYKTKPDLPAVNRIISQSQYIGLYKKHIREYISANGKPDLVHFYVGFKPASLGKWIKKEFGLNYVVSEQWTGFLDEGKPAFSDLPFWLQWQWKKLVRGAEGVHVVSSYLKDAVAKRAGSHLPFKIIANVVDTSIFVPGSKDQSDRSDFVHVTGGLGYQKNTEDIIKALAILRERHVYARLKIFGVRREELARLAEELKLQDAIIFYGEINQPELARHFQQAAALIIYSRFETFGCVIVEANASGIPVIAADIPVLHETIEEGRNGLFAAGENPEALANTIESFIKNKAVFDYTGIAKDCSDKYNYATIGREFSEWYESIILQNRHS